MWKYSCFRDYSFFGNIVSSGITVFYGNTVFMNIGIIKWSRGESIRMKNSAEFPTNVLFTNAIIEEETE